MSEYQTLRNLKIDLIQRTKLLKNSYSQLLSIWNELEKRKPPGSDKKSQRQKVASFVESLFKISNAVIIQPSLKLLVDVKETIMLIFEGRPGCDDEEETNWFETQTIKEIPKAILKHGIITLSIILMCVCYPRYCRKMTWAAWKHILYVPFLVSLLLYNNQEKVFDGINLEELDKWQGKIQKCFQKILSFYLFTNFYDGTSVSRYVSDYLPSRYQLLTPWSEVCVLCEAATTTEFNILSGCDHTFCEACCSRLCDLKNMKCPVCGERFICNIAFSHLKQLLPEGCMKDLCPTDGNRRPISKELLKQHITEIKRRIFQGELKLYSPAPVKSILEPISHLNIVRIDTVLPTTMRQVFFNFVGPSTIRKAIDLLPLWTSFTKSSSSSVALFSPTATDSTTTFSTAAPTTTLSFTSTAVISSIPSTALSITSSNIASPISPITFANIPSSTTLSTIYSSTTLSSIPSSTNTLSTILSSTNHFSTVPSSTTTLSTISSCTNPFSTISSSTTTLSTIPSSTATFAPIPSFITLSTIPSITLSNIPPSITPLSTNLTSITLSNVPSHATFFTIPSSTPLPITTTPTPPNTATSSTTSSATITSRDNGLEIFVPSRVSAYDLSQMLRYVIAFFEEYDPGCRG